jgi:hypothetical protein
VVRRTPVVLALVALLALAAGCRSVEPATGSAVPSVPASAASVAPSVAVSAAPSVPDFGDLAALRELLVGGGFRAGLTPQGYVTLSSGTSVVVTLTPNGTDLAQFRAISMEVAPLSALEEDPGAMPAVELVLDLVASWSPEAERQARRSLADVGTTASREGADEQVQRTEQRQADGFILETEASYGGDSAEDDYFRMTLTRDE